MTYLNRLPSSTLFLALVLWTVPGAWGQVFTHLVDLDGVNGSHPWYAGLIEGADGAFYGAAVDGGNSSCPGINGVGCGTVFRVTTEGVLTTVHRFDGADGAHPFATLFLAADGNFYGTTNDGGAHDIGTAFQLTPAGKLTTLHSFSGTPDGNSPYGQLIQGKDGNLYGTTFYGGGNTSCTAGCGTIFKITPAGATTIVHNFDKTNGAYPTAGLVLASDGNFYGTTVAGSGLNFGVFFKLTPAGTFTALHTFDQSCYNVLARMVQADDGNFYGTCVNSGNGNGAVFRITPQGTLTDIHKFQGPDGALPYGGLIQATDGSFYGTAAYGGNNSLGTLYKINSSGDFSVLHNFTGDDGAQPQGMLLQASDGMLYGTTFTGGANKNGTVYHGVGFNGTVFRFDLGLMPERRNPRLNFRKVR